MKDIVSFDDFVKSDIRAGTVLAAEEVPKSTKLLKLQVNFGPEGIRTILAGIAESYTPALIVGQRVLAVINLAPRQMMGFESHGMVLAGQDEMGKVWLATPPPVPDGTEVS